MSCHAAAAGSVDQQYKFTLKTWSAPKPNQLLDVVEQILGMCSTLYYMSTFPTHMNGCVIYIFYVLYVMEVNVLLRPAYSCQSLVFM